MIGSHRFKEFTTSFSPLFWLSHYLNLAMDFLPPDEGTLIATGFFEASCILLGFIPPKSAPSSYWARLLRGIDYCSLLWLFAEQYPLLPRSLLCFPDGVDDGFCLAP